MTQCGRCGLVSADDRLCSWCRSPLTAAPIAVESRAPVVPQREYVWVAMVAAALVLVVIAALAKINGSAPFRPPAVASAGVEQISTGTRQLRSVPLPGSPTVKESGPSVVAIETAPQQTPVVGEAPPTDSVENVVREQAFTPSEIGSMRLADASLATAGDDEGNEMAAGSVLIVNDGDYAITDFRITLQVNGRSYTLMPFSGSPEDPQPLMSRVIAPGSQAEVPVITRQPYPADSAYASRTVTVRATLAGPPGTITDTIDVP